MDEAQQETQVADAFVRQCTKHLGEATNVQKTLLMRSLLERPPESANKLDLAQSAWNGLEEKEVMALLGTLQKQFDKDTWEFMSRWRK